MRGAVRFVGIAGWLGSCLFVVCVGSLSVLAQQKLVCSQTERAHSVQTLRLLLATDIVTGRSLSAKRDTGHPAPQSTPLHAALAEYMRATMACIPPGVAESKSIADAMTDGLTNSGANAVAPDAVPVLTSRAGATMSSEDDPLTVHFMVVGAAESDDGSAMPHRIAILASIGPACGRRGQMGVFASSGGAWQQELTVPVAAFSLIAAQPASAQLVLSPPDLTGHWYAAIVSHEPSCRMVADRATPDPAANDWMRLQILRPAANHATTQLALQEEFVADLSGMSPRDWMQVDAQPDLLELRYNGIRSSTGEEVFAEQRAYRIEAAGVERVRTAAITPVDFVALWLAAPWTDALAWSDPAQAAALEPQHASLEDAKRSGACCSLFRAVYRCGAKPKKNAKAKSSADQRWIEISVLYPAQEQQSGERYFFLRQLSTAYGATDYQMERVGDQPQSDCGGENLLRHPDSGP